MEERLVFNEAEAITFHLQGQRDNLDGHLCKRQGHNA